jgi:hypothetical protein
MLACYSPQAEIVHTVWRKPCLNFPGGSTWSWIAGDFSAVALSNRFFAGGVIVILISLASGLGNWGNRSDWRQMLAQSAGQANLAERNRRMVADIAQVYALTLLMIPAGLVAILIAVLVGSLA